MGDAGYLPLRFADRGDNLIGRFLVRDFYVLAFVLEKFGFEERRLAGVEQGVDGPVFLRNESADFLFALDDQAESNGLDAPGGKAAADFIPEQGRDFVADDAVEDAASLLRVHEVGVDLARMLKSGANRFRE